MKLKVFIFLALSIFAVNSFTKYEGYKQYKESIVWGKKSYFDGKKFGATGKFVEKSIALLTSGDHGATIDYLFSSLETSSFSELERSEIYRWIGLSSMQAEQYDLAAEYFKKHLALDDAVRSSRDSSIDLLTRAYLKLDINSNKNINLLLKSEFRSQSATYPLCKIVEWLDEPIDWLDGAIIEVNKSELHNYEYCNLVPKFTVTPVYPRKAMNKNIVGSVVVEFSINEEGRPVKPKTISSKCSYEYDWQEKKMINEFSCDLFNKSATEATKKLSYDKIYAGLRRANHKWTYLLED